MATPALTINGRYQMGGKPVGGGGMGVVYKAYDIVTKRYVALKTMRGSLDSAALELFSKEWSVLAQLSHPNIVDVLDTGEFIQDGERRPFFECPFCPARRWSSSCKMPVPDLPSSASWESCHRHAGDCKPPTNKGWFIVI